MGHEEHKENAPDVLRCAVLTVSDTRDIEKDGSGKRINEMLKEEDHEVVAYEIIKDEKERIRKTIREIDAQIFVLNGGTGISERDVTPEAVEPLLDKEIQGFGEAFRYLSYEKVGSPAILSRATAGKMEKSIIFVLPGSKAAVELALKELILPEMGHMIYEVNK